MKISYLMSFTRPPKCVSFEIVSTRTIEPEKERKYVVYKIVVTIPHEVNSNKACLERRYNDFLGLYNGLKLEFPNQLTGLPFPRKVLVGNFKSAVISSRIAGFESLLSFVSAHSKLRRSKSFISFLQDKELSQVLHIIQLDDYHYVCPIVENTFRLLNLVETDRSLAVLHWLLLLVSVAWAGGDPRAASFAALALRRYQSVSDADLLRYFVPLLHTAMDISLASGLDTKPVLEQLDRLKAKGVNVQKTQNLLSLLVGDLSETTGRHSPT